MTQAPLDVAAAGEGEPALALLPGWCCDRSTLEPLAALFRPRHRTLAVDWRGFGRSAPVPPGYDLARTLADLNHTLAAATPGGVVVVGHSLGGRMALGLAERHPEVTRAVVLLDTSVHEPPEHVAARRAELEDPDWQPLLRARFQHLQQEGSAGDGSLVERMLATPLPVARSSLAAADAVDAPRALAGTTVPTLYVAASEPREDRSRLHRLRPDLEYGQVVCSSHFVQLDAPEQVAAMIESFLAHRLGTAAGPGSIAVGSPHPDDGATVL